MRENLSWRALQSADTLLEKVRGTENLHGHEFDRIKKEVKGAELIVTGEKTVAERAEGLGGSFTTAPWARRSKSTPFSRARCCRRKRRWWGFSGTWRRPRLSILPAYRRRAPSATASHGWGRMVAEPSGSFISRTSSG